MTPLARLAQRCGGFQVIPFPIAFQESSPRRGWELGHGPCPDRDFIFEKDRHLAVYSGRNAQVFVYESKPLNLGLVGGSWGYTKFLVFGYESNPQSLRLVNLAFGSPGTKEWILRSSPYMGGCQNYVFFLDPHYHTAPNI